MTPDTTSEENNLSNTAQNQPANQPEPNQQQSQPQPNQKGKAGDNNMIAILSYLGILFLIPLLAAKESEFAQYHAKQGLTLFIAEIATMLIIWIPFIGWLVGLIAWIVWLVLSVMGIINVVSGEKKPLPLIGKYSKKFDI